MRTADQGISPALTARLDGVSRPFEDIYSQLFFPLRNYLISLTGDRHRAEDLLQETFLQIHRSRHTYLPGRPAEPWAFGIARHVYLMDRRSARRLARHEVLPDDHLPDRPVRGVSESYPDRADLTRALIRVAGNRRQAVLLHHVWGYTFREVGQMLGITECAAKLRSFRGIESIRRRLGGNQASLTNPSPR